MGEEGFLVMGLLLGTLGYGWHAPPRSPFN